MKYKLITLPYEHESAELANLFVSKKKIYFFQNGTRRKRTRKKKQSAKFIFKGGFVSNECTAKVTRNNNEAVTSWTKEIFTSGEKLVGCSALPLAIRDSGDH